MKKSRLLKAEIIVLVCVAVLWAVNLKTHCVPRATAGALKQVVKVVPNSECAYDLLSGAYYTCGQYDEGDRAYEKAKVLACEKAVQSHPNDPNVQLDLGRAYYDASDFTKAIKSYQQAIRLDPDFLQAYMDLGDVYASSEQYERSVETYKDAAALDPNYSWVHVCLAFTYQDMGQYEDAIPEWEYLIEREPDIAGLRALLADVYLELGRYTEAIETCEEGLRIDSDNAKSHYNLGRAHLGMGDEDLASKEYEVLKQLDGEFAQEFAEELFTLITERSEY